MMKFWLNIPPSWAHALAGFGTELFSSITLDKTTPVCDPLTWRGLVFRNRWGIAGGVDKNADHVKAWWNLGAGFIEVGTVTLNPQNPNSGKIVDRDSKTQALWNRMGFPGEGYSEVLANLKQCRPYRTPVFVNIGKNRTTADEDAPFEYAELFLKFKPVADAFVINISSPNTQGLRAWLEPAKLEKLLVPIKRIREPQDPPLLLKLSPDQSNAELEQLMGTAWKLGIEGFILTNTTLHRENGSVFPPEGGVSGLPLKKRSEECLQLAVNFFKNELARSDSKLKKPLIISVGGVMTEEDVFARLKMGADLVQCYAALVYSGPRFFKHVAQKWKKQNALAHSPNQRLQHGRD